MASVALNMKKKNNNNNNNNPEYVGLLSETWATL